VRREALRDAACHYRNRSIDPFSHIRRHYHAPPVDDRAGLDLDRMLRPARSIAGSRPPPSPRESDTLREGGAADCNNHINPINRGNAMIREAPAMTVRQNLGDLLNEVQYRKGRIVITKGGKPVAALIDIALFERLRRLDEEFERLSAGLAKAFGTTAPRKGMALVDEAVKAARRKPPRK